MSDKPIVWGSPDFPKDAKEIEKIINTDPYQYKYLLSDFDAVEEKKNEIKNEKEDYVKYGEELDKVIAEFNIERMLA